MSAEEDPGVPEARDPIPDGIPESSVEVRLDRIWYQRHCQLFVLAFAPVMFALVLGQYRIVSGLLFVLAAVCWAGSGYYAIRGRRHMFGNISGGGMTYIKVKPSEKSSFAIFVGVILMLLSLGLANVAAQLLFTTPSE